MSLLDATAVARVTAEPLRIVAFGTSLTARGGWQEPLREALARCLGRPVSVDTVALSGSTSDWALAHVGDVVARRPDVVLVEFYANDAALNRFFTVGGSRANIDAILAALKRDLPRARIFGMAMSPAHGMRGFIRPYLADFIEAHRAAAAAAGAGFIDFRERWGELYGDRLDEAIPDGAHPTAAAATAVMVPELVRALAGDCSP